MHLKKASSCDSGKKAGQYFHGLYLPVMYLMLITSRVLLNSRQAISEHQCRMKLECWIRPCTRKKHKNGIWEIVSRFCKNEDLNEDQGEKERCTVKFLY